MGKGERTKVFNISSSPSPTQYDIPSSFDLIKRKNAKSLGQRNWNKTQLNISTTLTEKQKDEVKKGRHQFQN
jgi:hypothetical protein